LKNLLRDVLDRAVEHVQYAKQHRERVYDDRIYFTSSRRPQNVPEWTCKETRYEAEETDYEDELQYEEEYEEEVEKGEDYYEGKADYQLEEE
jgi:hypothetical protein